MPVSCLFPKMALFFGLFVVLFSSPIKAEPIEVKLGVIQSLSGPAEEDGKTILQALRMAQEEINEQGRFKVSLAVEDDGTVPKNSVSAYDKLRNDGVAAIIGPSWSFLVRALAPLAARDGMVLLTTSNAPEVLDYREAGGRLFSNSFAVAGIASPFSTFVRMRKAVRAAFIRTDTVWSHAHKAALMPVLQENGIALHADIVTPTVSNNDFRGILPRLKSSKVDLVLMLLSRDDSENLLRRAREIRYAPQYFAAAHTYDSLVRTRNIGLYEGLCLVYPYLQLRRQAHFFEAYKAKYKEEPRIYADTSYDALFIMVEAQARSVQTGAKLPDVLRQMSYRGVAGQYVFSPDKSLSAGDNDLLCIEDGLVVVKN